MTGRASPMAMLSCCDVPLGLSFVAVFEAFEESRWT
jgi:hypothetical protein